MLTYDLSNRKESLYEALYSAIREDILSGQLLPGQKLPSKRSLADHLKISKVTVETAYAQLLAEGYIRSREKVGYFVEAVSERTAPAPPRFQQMPESRPQKVWEADLTANSLPPEGFPFSVWTKLLREVMLDHGAELLAPIPICGALVLRQAISQYLRDFRSMTVSPEQIIVGAGTDFLYNLLIQLLGRNKIYAVEDPGYQKIYQVYEAAGVQYQPVPMDTEGVHPDSLGEAQVLHLSPSHHFPTGIVTPIARRQALISWAERQPGRYIIEDDYDSEFRLAGKPIPTMRSIDHSGRVIYLNSFTKSIAPSIRISYMVLPTALMEEFREKLGFYACTVPSFEQYTLASFLDRGYFEKHLSRMKKYYREQRNMIISSLESSFFRDKLQISGQDAGLHFLLKIQTHKTDRQLKELCEKAGIRVMCLSDYCRMEHPENSHCLVVNYTGFDGRKAEKIIANLESVLK